MPVVSNMRQTKLAIKSPKRGFYLKAKSDVNIFLSNKLNS